MTWKADYSEYFAARAAPLRRLGYGLSGDWHLAEDLVQHTFLQLYRHWRRLDPTTLDAYSRRTLVNAYLSHRRKKHETAVADVPERAAEPAPDLGLDIRAALDALPPRQRALVVLRHLEDISVAEAADLLGIAEGTVKSQTAHGLAKLRSHFGDSHG
ncbi:RNA polymerase sigma-70 factor (sigma-E family) [Hamadaea flava]|uniref:SigE family RNA polymerase sigma factor n=1 Tax=Hamadaea flava TaxID=1742688 RepID=A0ABV8LHI0_9ACTN|nr:SigE family RNA polymerase sigma factor [Hamadaea flava]MCP2326263.1 RNA polymerase sigma-70 factor (sigma-E family) [Hamadaea flava]